MSKKTNKTRQEPTRAPAPEQAALTNNDLAASGLPERIPYDPVNHLPGRPVADVVDAFLRTGAQRDEPIAVLALGPIASGKTTLRHRLRNEGYVALDPADVYHALSLDGAEVSDDIHERVEAAGAAITQRALQERRDIAFEYASFNDLDGDIVIGFLGAFGSLKQAGYAPHIVGFECSPETSTARDRARPLTNLSRYFTQRTFVRWMRLALESLSVAGSDSV